MSTLCNDLVPESTSDGSYSIELMWSEEGVRREVLTEQLVWSKCPARNTDIMTAVWVLHGSLRALAEPSHCCWAGPMTLPSALHPSWMIKCSLVIKLSCSSSWVLVPLGWVAKGGGQVSKASILGTSTVSYGNNFFFDTSFPVLFGNLCFLGAENPL